ALAARLAANAGLVQAGARAGRPQGRIAHVRSPARPGPHPGRTRLRRRLRSAKAGPEVRMLDTLRAPARIIREKIGWNRVGLGLSVTIIAIAAVVLYRMLEDLDPEDLVEALKATRAHQLLLAGLFVTAGYFTLTFYDLFALRTIGRRDVPYRIAALAGFTSYSIGHNIGASVFTGGAAPPPPPSPCGVCAGAAA